MGSVEGVALAFELLVNHLMSGKAVGFVTIFANLGYKRALPVIRKDRGRTRWEKPRAVQKSVPFQRLFFQEGRKPEILGNQKIKKGRGVSNLIENRGEEGGGGLGKSNEG